MNAAIKIQEWLEGLLPAAINIFLPPKPQSLGTNVWCSCLTFCPPSHSYIWDKSLNKGRRMKKIKRDHIELCQIIVPETTLGKWPPKIHRLLALHMYYFPICINSTYVRYEGNPSPVPISDTMSYFTISQSREAARFVSKMVRSLWNLTGTWQHCCRDARQISKRCDYLHYKSRSCETSQDLTIRRGPAAIFGLLCLWYESVRGISDTWFTAFSHKSWQANESYAAFYHKS